MMQGRGGEDVDNIVIKVKMHIPVTNNIPVPLIMTTSMVLE